MGNQRMTAGLNAGECVSLCASQPWETEMLPESPCLK